MLDVIVLIAMAVTATAFAAGLTVHSGVAMIPSVIAAAALYLVMAASYLMLSRQTKSTPVTSRLQELETAMEIIDGDLQRIDRVEDDVARLDLLNDRVERLDQAVSTIAPGEFTGSLARNDDFTAEFEHVHARIEGLRADLEGEARNQRDKIAGDLRALEGVIKQISNELSATASVAARAGSPVAPSPSRFVPSAPEIEPVVVEEIVAVYDGVPEEPLPAHEDVVQEDAVALPTGSLLEQAMLTVLNDAIEGGRIDLYLQPIVTLPDRKLRYYEGFTRVRTTDDEIVMPRDYLPVAENAGLMPIVDNALLVKSVQLLRKLRPDSRVKGVFCNISVQSLLDRDFFPELVEFMEENSGLSESLVFEVSQPAILALTRGELAALDTLSALGYGFSLDHVGDLDVDFAGLRDRAFRFVKIDVTTFLHGMKERGAALPAPDMKGYLEGFDLKLIIEKVEDEADVAKLLDYGIELAQGYLFGEPKAMSPQFVRELDGADAA